MSADEEHIDQVAVLFDAKILGPVQPDHTIRQQATACARFLCSWPVTVQVLRSAHATAHAPGSSLPVHSVIGADPDEQHVRRRDAARSRYYWYW